MAENVKKVEDTKKDPMMEAMINRVDNFVQVELQRRQFGNRYTKQERAGEPIADFQSISLKDYQVYKPSWAIIRALTNPAPTATLLGTSLGLVDDQNSEKKFGVPQGNYIDRQYETTNPNPDYISEYGTGGSYRPKPGLRNLSVSYEGSGLYATINMNIKAFTREQLNTLSNDYLEIGKEVLVMFGYSDPSNSSSIKSIVNLKNPDTEKGLLDEGKAELEGISALYSGGKLYSKIASVGGFDINVQPDDGSFDISITLYTEGILATFKATNDKLAQEAGIDILTNKSTPIQEKKGDEKEINYALYQDFLLKLRGFPEKSLSKHGKSKKFIIPTRDSIFTIGQGRTIKYTEMLNYERAAGVNDDTGDGTAEDPLIDNDERTNPPGFLKLKDAPGTLEKVIDVKEGEESDKSLTINDEFTTKLFPNPESNTPEDIEQFVVSVRPNEENGGASKSGNKEVQQMYLTWGLCEWIINNGLGYEESVEEGTIVKDILRKFSEPSLPRRVYSIPQKVETIPDEVTTEVPNESGEGTTTKTQTITKTVYTDDNEKRLLISNIPASHKEGTFIRSVQFPEIDTTIPGVPLKRPQTMGGLNSKLSQTIVKDGVQGKFLSNTVDVPNELFSTNPGICVLSKEKGLVSPVEVKEKDVPIEGKVFRMKDLHEKFSSFSESKEKIYVRNILVNAKWFFDEYVKYTNTGTEKSLKGLLDTLFTQISDCFNNVIRFNVSTNTDGALEVKDAEINQKVYSKVELETAKLDYREVDYLNKKFRIYNQITPLNVFGQDSITRDISYSMDLDSDIANHFFFKGKDDSVSTGDDILLNIDRLKKEKAILKASNKSTEDVEKRLTAANKSLTKTEPTAKSYLDLYLESATKTYGKLIPNKNNSVDFSSQSEILETKLTKILTSASVVNSKKELQLPPNTPKLPFKVDVTLDGIAGIKMFDAFHLTYVPALYQNGHFKVVGISHFLEGTDWSTKLSLIYVEAGEVRAEEF